jgi:hypothetical protein
MNIIIQFLVLLLLFCSSSAFDQHEETEYEGAHDAGAAVHDAHFHRNHIAIFVGATTKLKGKNDTDFTLGADYVRRFLESGRLGIGLFGEAIFAEHTDWVIGIPLYVFPYKNFFLKAGPGLEFTKEKEKSDSETSHKSKTETDTEFLIRAGVGYDIELAGFTIAPNLSFDFLRGKNTIVWGFNLGKGF